LLTLKPASKPIPLLETRPAHALRFNIHEVQDYSVWKAIFDKAAGIRKAAGELSYQLLKFETDANNVVHFSRWTSLDNARRFFESPELIEIRRNAGVKAPEFIYLEEIEQSVL